MKQYIELISSLELVIDLAQENGVKCQCNRDYQCRLCKAKKTLQDAKDNISRGTIEGVRPRRKIYCITTDTIFDSLKDAGEKYGVQPATISKCCKGKLKHAGRLGGVKLEWRYAD